MSDPASAYTEHFDAVLVVDVAAPIVYIGRLIEANEYFLTLVDVDVHELAGTSTTKEVYIMEAKRNGVQPCRKLVKIKQSEVLSFSPLADVIVY